MSANYVVVHTAGLAMGAPDPRDRQLLRRVLALAATAQVTLVCVEPQLGPRSWPELDAAGVSVIAVPARLDEWLCARVAQAGSITAIIATSVALGAQCHASAPDVALVLDLDSLGPASPARAEVDDDPLERPGAATMLCHATAQARRVLEHACMVVAGGDGFAGDITRVAPGAHVVVVAPPVPSQRVRRAPRGRGVAVVGHFTDATHMTAEVAIRELAEGAGDECDLAVVGVDTALLRRSIAPRIAVVSPRDFTSAVLDLRVAVVVDGDDACAAELRGMGVPTVLHDHAHIDQVISELRTFVSDDDAWGRAHRQAIADAAEAHDPGRAALAYLAALDDCLSGDAGLGGASAPTRVAIPPPLVDSAPTWVACNLGGSLAAQTASSEQLRREAQPDAILPWQHALYTNLDLAAGEAYRRWLRVHHDVAPRREVFRARTGRFVNAPLISILMPVHNTDPALLRAAVESVKAQLYPHWQLCIADDGSTRASTRQMLQTMAFNDARVTVARIETPVGIAAATNLALQNATGTYIAFCDHDDVLTEDALYWVARAIDFDPNVDIVYSDEDKLDFDGRRVEPFCKPDWSPDLLLSCNYITHLLVVRKSTIERVGGLRPEYDGAQDYDLLLRLTEITDRVVHVPKPLYSWRKTAGSTAADIDAKPQAHGASRAAIDDAVARRGLDATRESGVDPTWHRVRYRIRARPVVTVVIATRDRLDLLAPCIELLRRHVAHRPLELLVVDNESIDPATVRYLDTFDGRVVRYPHRFNYARQMNLAVMEARGEVVLLLNNDARPVGNKWFDAMLEHALRPEVGAVGARLRFPDGRAQHEGVVLNAGGVALNLDAGPYAVLADNVRDVAAVTGACMMLRRSVWDAVGGMDERLRVAYNDVDLCLRIGERGWRNIYTPLAEIVHAESSSRGSLHPEVDEAFYQARWGAPRTCADPFFTTSIELLSPFSPRL